MLSKERLRKRIHALTISGLLRGAAPRTNSRRIYGALAVSVILASVFASTTSFVQANPGTPPEYRNVGPTNGTSLVAGENLTLYAQGYSDVGLSWAWLSTNETGAWKNYTHVWSDCQASGSNPILDGDSMFGEGYMTEDSKILKVADTYFLFTATGSTGSVMEIYMLNSSSLTGPWNLMNNSSPIIPQSTSGWDQGQLRMSSVMYYDGTYYLYYMGTDGSGSQSVGVATTSDANFPNGWRKYSGNPVLAPTGTGWESGGVYSLDLERIGPAGNEWYGHYTATDKTGPGGGYWSVGICYGASPYGPFTRHTSNPILERGVGEWDNLGLPRIDIITIGNMIYGSYEAASTNAPWDFQVGEYSGEVSSDILSVVFSKNPSNPIIPGDAGSATQTANPCWWYENETRYLFAGGGFPSPYRWQYIDLFTSHALTQHGSPLEMYNVAHSWTWSNFTWSSSAVQAGTTVQWMIYFLDTEGNVSRTAINSFRVEAPEYDFVDFDTSDVDGSADKGTHSNFEYEKACDDDYDTLLEERIGEFGAMSYRKNLTINHECVDGDQTGFPVLIDLYDTDLHDDVQPSGDDIAFTDSSGSQLDHEIEYFNKDHNGTHAHLIAWVRANLSDTLDTTICMIYGNPTSGSQQNPTGIWEGDYEGVWHLVEDASGVGTVDLYKDSTLHNNDGNDEVSATGKAGRIDGGQEFDGADDYIKVDDSPGLGLDNDAAFEGWVQPSSLSGYQVVLRKAPNNALLDFAGENYGVFLHDDEIYFEFYSGGTYRYHETASANLQTGNWYYLVVVYDNVNDRVKIYLNGNNVLDEAQTNALVDYTDTHLRIGDRYFENGQHFHGYLDEVRISSTTRTAGWLNTTYQNTQNLANFLSIGSEELPASPATYELDLEIQWTNVNYTRTYEDLCIKTGAFSGSEDIQMRIWNSTGPSWHWVMNLTANQANNVSVGSYLTESTFTVQLLGGTEVGDTDQDSWDIGCALVRTRESACTVWYEPFDDNTNAWTLSSGASISGGVLDCSSTYATGQNSLDFLDNFTIFSMSVDFDAYRGDSSSAIVGVDLYYLDYRVHVQWNYYSPHGVFGFGHLNSSGNVVKTAYPQESGWRNIRVVLEGLTTVSPRASYYFENEGILKTVAENQALYYSPNPTKVSMVNGYSSTVQYDNLTISYCGRATPILSLNPTSISCRKYGETYMVRIDAANACDAEDFSFEIHYNATLLDVVAISWNAWGAGTCTVDEVNGNVSGYTSGSPLSVNATLITVTFNATYHHVWRWLPSWTNNQTGAIYVQWANLSYSSGPDLGYVRGGLNQINVDPDASYTFCPIRGDLDNDGTVDIFDILQLVAHYNQEDPEYNLVGDPVVDIFDVVTAATNYGTTYTPPQP